VSTALPISDPPSSAADNPPRSQLARHSTTPAILFTAFEPSGDEHASAIITELRHRHPALPIYAWGGPKMQAAGATIIERTGEDAVMGVPGYEKIREHQRINARIESWLAQKQSSSEPITLHVPVDSPAANFPICALAKAHGITVVHVVAPQIWAWARWRIHKLRRRTNLVLCILPFEERFFTKRNVPARFIGHFLFDEPLNEPELDRRAALLPRGSPNLAIMPGSRPDEVQRNFPLMLEVFRDVRREFPQLQAVVAATRPTVETMLRAMAAVLGPPLPENNGWPAGIRSVIADTDAVVRWSDVALVKSGTVTMQVTKQLRPMVIFYKKHNPLIFALVKTIVATRLFSLPNVIAARAIVPEFVPHYGGSQPITAAVLKLLRDPQAAQQQRADLAAVVAQFHGKSARKLAADAIEEILGFTHADHLR